MKRACKIEIKLIGPGGAGKTTAGKALAKRLGIQFFDLDECFIEESGEIDRWIDTHGYINYAHQNVENYLEFAPSIDSVCALSSGFMTYPKTVHPDYVRVRSSIYRHPQTFTLLPCLDKERCVAEIVRRQLARQIPTASSEREEEKIRQRFDTYLSLGNSIVETIRTPGEIAEVIARRLNGR